MHLNPPFRAEHIGSLLRPPVLLEKRGLFEQRGISAEELRAAEDEAVERVVRLQRDVGMRTITDGEMRRGMFFEGVFDNLEGMTVIPNRPIETFKKYIPHIGMMYAYGVKEAETIFCSGKIKRTKPLYLDQFNYVKKLVSAEDVKHIKVTMCSPSWYHQRHGSDFTYDLSVYKNDGKFITRMEEAGVDHEALLDTYIHAINVCTRDRPSDLTVGVHMCRGNFKNGVHFSEGGYDRIAMRLFNKLDVDTFYLEYDTERAGDFTPLKYLPNNKVAVLGLVTTKNPKLETVEELKARVMEAVDAMTKDNPARTRQAALNQLCISTQCGFASVWEGNPVTEEDQRKKLAVLVEAAKQIW
ncbi:hypothetical protein C0992_008612 [Termitomyces sp. T32_za158]|nr:hypothetical protein C0992_008612 [Termitomyces sp. T32_za158]